MLAENSLQCILIVDDDPMQMEYYLAVLEPDYEVIQAFGFAEALAILGSDAPVDVFACDLHLNHGHSGMELLAWIGEHRPELMAYSIIISGDLVLDANAYTVPVIFKPVLPDMLIQSMQQMLGQRVEVQ